MEEHKWAAGKKMGISLKCSSASLFIFHGLKHTLHPCNQVSLGRFIINKLYLNATLWKMMIQLSHTVKYCCWAVWAFRGISTWNYSVRLVFWGLILDLSSLCLGATGKIWFTDPCCTWIQRQRMSRAVKQPTPSPCPLINYWVKNLSNHSH